MPLNSKQLSPAFPQLWTKQTAETTPITPCKLYLHKYSINRSEMHWNGILEIIVPYITMMYAYKMAH